MSWTKVNPDAEVTFGPEGLKPFSPIFGWRLGDTRKPDRATFQLAQRVIEQGAPDLVNLLQVVDVVAAREIVEMWHWPRIGNWRTDTDDVPDDRSLRLARHVAEKFVGRDDGDPSVRVMEPYDLGECRRMLELAGEDPRR